VSSSGGHEAAAGRRPRWLRRPLLLVALLGIAAAPTGWVVSDALERNNDFCTSCHLREGVPLHGEIRRGFDARPALSLAGLHADAGRGSPGARAGFRCIDCHGGVGLVGRARVKLLAARDAFWYVVGDFGEPTDMAWPLWDADCRQCHTRFRPAADEFAAPAFHSLGVHNVELGVTCVECHEAHEREVEPEASFLNAARVRAQCARCHAEFAAH